MILRTSRLSRRQLLRSTAAGAALAPFLPVLDARAAAPKRIVFLYSSNGTTRELWLPKMVGTELQLSTILAPLERHKADLLVIDGLAYSCAEKVKGGHEGGITSALTGATPTFIDGKHIRSTGISVDQQIANRVGAGLKFKSIECGIQVDTYEAEVCAPYYTGPLQPIIPQNEPAKVFARLFGDVMLPGATTDPTAARRLRQRQSVIDFVRADLNALRGKLAAEEQKKVDRHLQVVREIELSLSTGAGAAASASCKKPAAPTVPATGNDNIPRIGDVQTDLLLAALTCDLTRVGSIQYGRGGANHRFTWLGEDFKQNPAYKEGVDTTTGIHSFAHAENNPATRPLLAQHHRWFALRVAELVDKLKAIPEGAGTMADNTLVVWWNEMGTGSHSLRNTPWVLVGNAQKYFKTGRVVSFPGKPHNPLLVSLCQAMGLDITTFGAPELNSGPLVGLT